MQTWHRDSRSCGALTMFSKKKIKCHKCTQVLHAYGFHKVLEAALVPQNLSKAEFFFKIVRTLSKSFFFYFEKHHYVYSQGGHCLTSNQLNLNAIRISIRVCMYRTYRPFWRLSECNVVYYLGNYVDISCSNNLLRRFSKNTPLYLFNKVQRGRVQKSETLVYPAVSCAERQFIMV